MRYENARVKDLLLIAAGFGMYWAWTLSIPMGSFAQRTQYSADFGLLPMSSTAAHMAALALALLLPGLCARVTGSRRFFPIAAATVCTGTLLTALGLCGLLEGWSVYLGGVLGGVGSAGVLLSWSGVLAGVDPGTVKSGVSCSFPVGLIINLVGNAISVPVSACFIAAMPLLSYGCFRQIACKGRDPEEEAGQGPGSDDVPAGAKSPVPVRLVTYCLLFCIPYGLFLGQLAGPFDYPTAVFFACVAAVALLAMDLFGGHDVVFKAVLPLSSAGLLMLAFVAIQDQNLTGSLTLMGNTLFMTYVYTELALFSTEPGRDPARVMATGDLAQSAGLVVGSLLGLALMDTGDAALTGALVTGLYLAVLIGYFLFAYRRDRSASGKAGPESLWKSTAPFAMDESPASMPDARTIFTEAARRSCLDVAESRGLSKREGEVLVLLAEGRTIADISGALYLSPSTVKTYVKRIYGKLEVHSRDEMLRLLGIK